MTIILLTLLFIAISIGLVEFARKGFRKTPKQQKQQTFNGLFVPKNVAKAKQPKENAKTKYPLFIPFYQWHGFFNGLQPENKKFFITKGKQGSCPKRFNNPFTNL